MRIYHGLPPASFVLRCMFSRVVEGTGGIEILQVLGRPTFKGSLPFGIRLANFADPSGPSKLSVRLLGTVAMP
jgi:hypothetical protein